MIEANLKITVDAAVDVIWQKITDFGHQDWRSDLTHTEILSDHSFVEHAKNGTKTTFKVTSLQPYERLELEFVNNMIFGTWVDLFYDHGTHTTLDFTEKVRCRPWWMRFFAGHVLQKMQRQYMRDLLKTLDIHELGSSLHESS